MEKIFQDRIKECPLCKNRNLSFLYEIDRFETAFIVDKCSDCGHIFINPPWDPEYTKKIYSEDYYRGKAEYHYHDEREQLYFEKKVWHARLKRIRQFVSHGNFCDIGCSFGGFLKEASVYYKPFGVEISSFSASEAKKIPGITLFNGHLEDVPWENESLDIITAIEVIEHLPNPESFLKKVGALLKPGGLLVIQTADFDGWQAINEKGKYHYFLPGHLHYFHSGNLKQKMQEWVKIDRIIEYRGTDFGLMAKLQKSRGSFQSLWDYRNWLRIIFYHLKSKIRWKGRYLTSAMVLYGIKKNNRGLEYDL